MSEPFKPAFDRLLTLVPELVETMFFAEAEAANEPFPWTDDDQIWARIELMCPIHSEMWVAVGRDLAEEWLDMMGQSPEDSALRGLVGEFANTIAGRLQIELAGEDEDTRVGLPAGGVGAPKDTPDNLVAQTFVIDETSFAVGLSAAA